MKDSGGWSAVVTIRQLNREATDHLARALEPEVTREVSRARSRLTRPSDDSVSLKISAHDTGALRAALNTYLGWVHLALATTQAAREL